MRKIFKYKLIGLTFLIVSFASCDTADQDVSPVVSPSDYPVATYTPSSASTTLLEGDTLTYTITLDKPIDRAMTFKAKFLDGTASSGDYTAASVVMQPYTTEAKLLIIATYDNFPEVSENIQLELGVYGIADRYLLNPSQVNPELDLTIGNVNDPTLLTIVFSWPVAFGDIDIVTWQDNAGTLEPWGDGGATSANPETDKSIWLADPVGDYYVNIIDWGADPFPYKFILGHPDGTTQIIEGTFNTADYGAYTLDPWTAWGGSYDSYRILKVVNNGTSFVVTAL